MADIVQHSLIQALAWALVHFLWQGAAIGLASVIAFRLVRSASLRYAIGVGALVAMIAAPATTLVVLNRESAARTAASAPSDLRIAIGPITLVDASTGPSADATATGNLSIAPEALAVAVLAWLAGVAFFGVRLIGGWIVARRLTQRAVRPAADHIQAVARQLADRLAINRAVTILQSSAVVVPVMVGWLKPAVILPMAALAGLSPSQMEALLAHELAHVRRQDYLVNLLQSVAEALLFYHPAVWWLSHRVRADCELCCDDLAVSVCDPLVYATALTDLAAMTSPGLALAATDGDLLARVRRILGHSEAVPTLRAGAMPLLSLVLIAGVAVPVALASTQVPVVVRPVEVAVEVKPEPVQAVVRERQVVVEPEGPQPVAVTVEREGRPVTVQQTSQQQTEQQRAKVEELVRKVEEYNRALADLEAQRVATAGEQAAVEQKLLASQKVREIEILAAQRQFDDMKRQFEAGLVSQAQLNDARNALMKAQAAGNPEAQQKVELQAALEQLARSRQLAEKGVISQRDVAVQEQKLMLLETIKEKPTAAQVASVKELYDLLAQRKAAVGEQAAAAEQLMRAANENLMREVQARSDRVRDVATEGQPVAANEPIKAGDYLRINIEGETDLRTSYRVSDDGTIRIPLLGAVKVVGLTAAQVRDAVGKQLAAHKLGTAEQVKVTLTRVSRVR